MKFLRQVVVLYALIVGLGGISTALAVDLPTLGEGKESSAGLAAKDLVLKGDAKCTRCHDETDSPKLLSIGKTKHGTTADGRTPTCTSCHGDIHILGFLYHRCDTLCQRHTAGVDADEDQVCTAAVALQHLVGNAHQRPANLVLRHYHFFGHKKPSTFKKVEGYTPYYI